jgi:photosystem II stability/assembly factor-like uncharacterized protein
VTAPDTSPSVAGPSADQLPAATGPGRAREWRRLAWKDEQGQIDPDALRRALRQRSANVSFWQAQAAAQGRLGEPPTRAGLGPADWRERGPDNVGGRTRSLVIHPTQTNRMWAGAVSGGIWSSEDAGATWSVIDDWMNTLAICSLAIDPQGPNVMYAGTGEGFFNGDAVGGAGIYKSTDGGATWQRLPSTTGWDNVCRIAISPDDSDVLLAARRCCGIYRSADGGASWTLPRWAQGSFYVAFDPTDGQKAIAQIIDYDFDIGQWFHSALYSANGGLTWNTASGPLARVDGFGSRIELAYAPSQPGIVYASCATDGGKIWRSTDGGQSYVQRTVAGASGANWYANPLWVDPTDPDFLLTGGIHVYKSVDGGLSLIQISSGYIMTDQAHPDIHFFTPDPGYDGDGNRRVYVCTDGGVWVADDIYLASIVGGWARREQTYRTTQFYGAAGHGAGGLLIGGTQDNGTLRLDDLSDDATLTFGGDGGFCAIDPTDPAYTYGEYIFLKLHRSTNGGMSASYIYAGIDDAGNDANFIAPFILDPNDPRTLLAGGRSLWRSTDVKAPVPAWSAIKGPGTDRLSAVAVAPGNSDIIWVGQNNGEIQRTNDGTADSPSWAAVDNNSGVNPLPNRFVTRIVVDPDASDVVWVCLGGFSPDNLWNTTDGGSTWADITGTGLAGLPDAPIRGFARHPEHPGWLYVGTEVGVFASDDGGASWSTSDFGPAGVSVDEVVFMHGSSTLLAATHGRGLFTIGIGGVGDLDGDGVVGVNDLLLLLAAWGPCPLEGVCPADLDGDGEVGIGDLLMLLANWG